MNNEHPTTKPTARPASPPLPAGPSAIENLVARVQFGLLVLRRWGLVCFFVGIILAVAAGAAVWLTYEPTYRGEAWIRIEHRRPTIISSARAAEDSRDFVMTQIQIIRSSLVLGQVLKEPDIAHLDEVKEAKSPIDWLTEHLQVKNLGQSELYVVQFDGPNPAAAANIANKVVDAYINVHSDRDSREAQRMLDLLESELERRSKELERIEENVWELTKRVTGEEPELSESGETRQIVIAQQSTSDEQRLGEAELERQMLELELKAAEETMKQSEFDLPNEVIDQAVAEHESVKTLTAEVDALTTKLQRTVQAAARGSQDAMAVQLQKELNGKNEELAKLKSQLRTVAAERLEARERSRLELQVAQLRKSVSEKRRIEEFFQKRVQEQLAKRQNVSGLALELELARSQLSRKRDLYDQIANRVIGLQTEMRAPTRVAPFQPATPPVDPVEIVPYKKIIMAALFAMCIPFGIAVAWESVVRRVLDTAQLEESAGVSVIGEIAALPARRRSHRDAEEFARHQELYEESIDAFRTNLTLNEQMQDVKIVAVASAVSAEGKTTLASQLAVSLARGSGSPTLLIDGDLRAPDIHTIFDAKNDVGLADLLDGKVTVTEAIVTDWHEHLHVLPAGKLLRSPYVLLGKGNFESVLDEVREKYRFIVIDAPPILSASEALIIAKAADGTILCTMRDRSRAPQLKLARQRLDSAGVRVLGAVLAGVPARSYSYKYGGYYYYGNHNYQRNRGPANGDDGPKSPKQKAKGRRRKRKDEG